MTTGIDGPEHEEPTVPNTSRRRFLTVAVAAGTLAGAGSLSSVFAQQEGDTQQIELIGRAGGWEGVAPSSIEGQMNPTLALVAGTEYEVTWTNGDGAPHNFNVEDGEGSILVTTEIMSEQDATQTTTFTASEAMAEYFCEVHPTSMRGSVDISMATETETATPTETDTPTETEMETETETETPAEEPTASVTFDDQTSDGTSVVVQSVTMSEGGFVTIHDSSLLDGDALGSAIGVSEALDAGTHEDVDVPLFDVPGGDFETSMLSDDQTLIAMPHLDTNGNGTYDFVSSEGSADGPYTDEEGAVVDDATITIEQEDVPEPQQFSAQLSGDNEVPPVDTDASGAATFTLEQHEDGPDLHYELTVSGPWNGCVTQAHIHVGGPDENGPVVAFLFETADPLVDAEGTLSEGILTADDLVGPLEDADFSALATELQAGNTYVNVHTTEHPAGEIRGQIGG